MKVFLAAVAAVIIALPAPARAQAQEPKPIAGGTPTIRVQLVLSRFQGEKKISSMPYTLSINPDERNRSRGSANLRVGGQVPITTMSRQSGDANAPLVPSVQYRDVGTSIDCNITVLDEVRFRVDLSVEDSSIDTTAGSGGNSSHPAFRSFRTSESLLLRDGQSSQYTTATDKITGEVWKVDITLTVVK